MPRQATPETRTAGALAPAVVISERTEFRSNGTRETVEEAAIPDISGWSIGAAST